MTTIEPIPHAQPLPTRGLRAWLSRPTRAQLVADVAHLRQRVAQLHQTATEAVTYAQVGDDAYNRLLNETKAFDREYERRAREIAGLRQENEALKAAHRRTCDERDAEKARADRLATAAGLVAGAVDGEVVNVHAAAATAPAPTFARIARRRHVPEFDPEWVTTGWNRRDAQAAVAESPRRAIGGAA